jgi:hypothetical protein
MLHFYGWTIPLYMGFLCLAPRFSILAYSLLHSRYIRLAWGCILATCSVLKFRGNHDKPSGTYPRLVSIP